MSYFGKELLNALTRPFKLDENNECYKWVQMLGSLLDEGKECIFNVRRLWFLSYSYGKVLDIRGEERDLSRWYGESDESYKKRLEGAFALYAAGGTLPGMTKALKQIGYGDVDILERSGPTWAHFLLTFEFYFGQAMAKREWDILNFSIWRMKPAHTMPRYFLSFRPDPPQTIKIQAKPGIYGEITASHPILWAVKKFYYIDGSLMLNGSITLGDGWCEAVYLDGKYLMNGSTLLDGFTAVEDDGWRWRDNPLHRPSIDGTIGPIRPFPNQVYRLDGRELLDGSLLLDAIKVTNTKIGHHRTYIERFDENGNSQGREEIA